MKYLIPILTIILFSNMAQSQKNTDSYDVLWKNVQKLENEVLTKSALKVVRSISEKAKKEKKSPQIIKALLYTSKYAMILEEDAQLKIVNDFKTEIEKSEFPVKNVLESYLANLYWQYFQQNRYQFYNRTKTEVKVDTMDFRTWDLTTLFEEINLHFEASLKNPKALQKIAIDDFKEILHHQKGSEIYRPTLFDLLAHTALEFYKTNENNITRPVDKFEIDNPDLLCGADQFLKQKINIEDKTSLQSKALQVYQQLTFFHLSQGNMDALVEVDIERLKFIYQNAVFPNKDQHFLEVLRNTTENVKHHGVSTLYKYEIASLYNQWGNTYNPKNNTEHQWKQKEALEVCESVITTFPKSRGAHKCKDLKTNILTTNLQLTTERFIPINKPSRLLVNYKNLTGLTLSVYKVPKNDLKKLERLYPETKKLAFIRNLELAKSWKVELRNEGDHQSHSTEVLVPELDNGLYIILAHPKEKSDSFAYSHIQTTNLALVETRSPSHHIFQVIDRNNGQPKKEAKLKLSYQENYDRKILTKTFISDNLGMAKIPLPNRRWTSVSTTVTVGNDTAHFGEYYIDQKQNSRILHRVNHNAFLFTDRSIYRPGQPLYFKGITVVREDGISAVQPNTPVTVTLRDANYQEVVEQDFMTNEFGSFSGEFIIPDNGLTGNFSLLVRSKAINLNGSTDFSVEEYKRPKFETSFEPITETFKVNDSITVKGTAKAYAGSTITNAKVVYRVKRVVQFPRWYYWYRPYFNATPQEIAHGETRTDALGKYEISFKAIPDHTVDKENLPVFNYEVTIDVTDINGETRSAKTMVGVGYHTLTANISVDQELDKGKRDNALTINTQNLNGQFAPSKGSVKIYKLKAPSEVLRTRPWKAPDYDGFSKTEFKKLFPNDAFKDEHDPLKWEKGELVLNAKFDTGKSTKMELGNIKNWISGQYLIELESKDKFGQEVKDVAQTMLFSEKDKKLPDNQLFHIKTDKDSYSIGDKASITLYSNAEKMNVTVTVEKDRKIMETYWFELNDDSKTFSVPVTEDDLGGFAINYSFSAYNSFQSNSLPISVLYPKTDLEIETITFRDKLRPGTDETWNFKIKGPKGDKVAAELLASMYDASLDAFRDHSWNFNPVYTPYYYSNFHSNAHQSFGTDNFHTFNSSTGNLYYRPQHYDALDWFGLHFGHNTNLRFASGLMKKRANSAAPMEILEDRTELEETIMVESDLIGNVAGMQTADEKKEENGKSQEQESFDGVPIRKNLQETAFFFPQLMTDKEGNVSFGFTTPEALTQWKLQLLAHTKTLQSAVTTLETVTQKELMVIPNAPRFLREGDQMVFSTKISNLTDKPLSGQAKLELIDAISGKEVSSRLLLASPQEGDGEGGGGSKDFEVDSLGNTQVSWTLEIPSDLQAIQYKVIAKTGDFSDGEQNTLPVLTNRMLVTETLPMWVRSNQTRTFILNKLKNNTSTTLRHHKLTLEITSNPAWYAVQALPYLMEYPYDCNEQIFSRFYANSLASHIANNNPRIQEVFDLWANSDVLISNLEKNRELKSLLIQETPWLRDARSETEQKKRIALLFNLNKMKNGQTNALNKLRQNQMSSGAWAWFKGGRENRFITQHIIIGLGHLKKLGVTPKVIERQQMVKKAIAYLDKEFIKEYEHMKKYAKNINDDHLSHTQIHYLYMRSFFNDVKISKKIDEIRTYYIGQAKKYWTDKNLYSKGLLALTMHRMNEAVTASKILKSLEENSIDNEELGMYWKENTASSYWYQAPIETQALLIEAFSEIQNDVVIVDNLKIWLLKNKQTNQWKTTKATTEAVYALLLQGSDWLSVTDAVDVLIGGKEIEASKLENVKVEAGTGYYKTFWNGEKIDSKMAEVQLTKKEDGIAWGTLYWQYFEDLDKISPAKTPLQLKKKLFLKKNTDTGEQISEIDKETSLKVGDLIRVRIELKADRPMEFVHMKDMRASGLEPINVLSRYKWQDGLGYYESTKDASTNFFFDYLPKGVYVFEYDLRVNNAGNFSNGITTVQSMYAPEFSSHGEGIRISIDNDQ